MVKRRWNACQPPTSAKKRKLLGLADKSEDEVATASLNGVATPSSAESELLGAPDRLRAGATVLANGTMTPKSSVSPRKARVQNTPEGLVDNLEDNDDDDDDSEPEERTLEVRRVERHLHHVDFPGWDDGPAFTRSSYGWQPQTETFSELDAVTHLIAAYEEEYDDSAERPEYTYFTLDHFTIYRPADTYGHALELVALDKLSRDRHPQFCFDGYLCFGEKKCYVKGVSFATLTVDGYGDDDAAAANMADQLCIQSYLAQRQEVWYRLANPAPEYRRFYSPFLWLARFTKHFVDYLLTTKQVTISHFRTGFHKWLRNKYRGDMQFLAWLETAKLDDFRTTVVANIEFLWKECYGTQGPNDEIRILKQPIWSEVHPFRLSAIPEQPNRVHRTIVTPFAAQSFRSMYFADQFLETSITDPATRALVDRLKKQRGLPPMRDQMRVTVRTPLSEATPSKPITSICAGEVVIVRPETDGKWKSASESAGWYAYVQRVRKDTASDTRLDVIWLYQSEDTTMGKAPYRYQNELFFSDNCDCGKDALYLDCVVGKANVTWFARDGEAVNGMFAWRKFRTVHEMDQYDYVVLKKSDFKCHHHPDYAESTHKYAVGDTVLYQTSRDSRGRNCEPAVIADFNANKDRVWLRKLARRETARPNELLLTSEVIEIETGKLVRECHVQFFTQEQIDARRIPAPYDRDGTGDYFYIARPDTDEHSHMKLGWLPSDLHGKKLTGLGIFCGGGTFDRGLEEGGAVKFRYAVDWAQKALHSYRANTADPSDVKFFLGSVDDYLAKAMAGQFDDRIARPGSVLLISAGSPCQGFSRLQLSTASPESKKNASMVAAVVSFVDFYVPEYMLLENVVSMTESVKERKEHNVFSQIIAALVGLGYQVQQFLADSWSSGSPQQRSRVFIIATAPSVVALSQPESTHAHPTRHYRMRKLGKSSNGLPFGTRNENPFVPFPFVTAEEAVRDLPALYDALPQICPSHPDHRAQIESIVNRDRISMIPTRPRGWGLVQAKKAGKLRGEPLAYFDRLNHIRSGDSSKSYARVYPDHLFPTIVTKLAIADGLNGRTLHWDEHRPLSLMEARRAQGYLDHEVLVGTHGEQMKIVGNSVDRKVALALGLAVRQSWLQSGSTSGATDEADDFESVLNMLDAETHGQVDNSSVADSTEDLTESSDIVEGATQLGVGEGDTTRSVGGEVVDNRLVKMSLVLSQEEIAEVRRAEQEDRGVFKEILRIMDSREHRAARQSLHGGTGIDDEELEAET